MKYNIFEFMIVIGFVLFCIDSTPLLLIGGLLVLIGGKYIYDHQEDYLDEEVTEEHECETYGERKKHHAA